MDLTVEGNIYIQGGFQRCCLGVENGKIVAIKKILKSDNHHNFRSMIILPGGIDIHVHFREPGFTYKEDFTTGSIAAAFGGITCFGDMPNTKPPTVSKQTLLEKKRLAEQKSVVDFGLYAGVTNTNILKISELAMLCNGYKVFLGGTTNTLHIDDSNLENMFQQIGSCPKPVLIHAELHSCLQKYKGREENLQDHLRCRPSICEEQAINRVLEINGSSPTRMHFCHVSSAEGIEALRNRSKQISFGVTPHHLFFDVSSVKHSDQNFLKVNPPLRQRIDREAVFSAVVHGGVDVLESDHAPHSIEEKQKVFSEAPSGVPGVETMYPLMLRMAVKEKISFSRVISLVCERPGEFLQVKKGKLQVGFDADFIVVNPKEEIEITSDRLHSKCAWNPYEGFYGCFAKHVFIRGEHIINENCLVEKPGFGQWIGEDVDEE